MNNSANFIFYFTVTTDIDPVTLFENIDVGENDEGPSLLYQGYDRLHTFLSLFLLIHLNSRNQFDKIYAI